MSSNTNKTSPRDVLLHILEAIALYISVGSFIALLFGYINIFFPDALQSYTSQYARDALQWPIATLVVTFPLYLWLTTYIQKDVEENPAKKQLKTRRWLLYLTLFFAIIIIAGDLITLIYYFISGGLTTPFLLKVAAVLVVALTVFVYYGWILQHKVRPQARTKMKFFVRVVAGLGIITILAGFFVIGSPFELREKRFDQERVRDLQMLQQQILTHWETTGDLPQDLSSLEDEIRGISIPEDPETGEPYQYNVTGETSFELCATFNRASETEAESRYHPVSPRSPLEPTPSNTFWEHKSGDVCFERTIDPERHPPQRD